MKADNFHNNLMNLQSHMLNFAMILTSNRDDAHDLLQDTTLKALDNQSKYQEGTNFKGWVFTIMRNIFINNYRRSRCAPTINDTTDNLYHLNLSEENRHEAPEQSLTVNEINEAIRQLPEELRTPFAMHIAGYKYQEIADRTNLPIGTVKSRIFLTRRRLQTRFSDYQ